MDMCLISIVVPVYNVEKYLKVCIESIINQTFKNIEIILVNDGSTDSSLEICKLYLIDSRVKIIDKKNEGLSSARQAGIDYAKGQYICTVDSDDHIEKEFIEKMYTKISSEESDICVCATKAYRKNYSRVYNFSENEENTVNISRNDIEENYYTLLNKYYMSDSWNKMYRAEFVRESGVRFSLSKEYNGTDLLFNYMLMLHLPRISVINQVLYNYQILENSRVRRKNKQLQEGFMIILSKIINEIDLLKYSDEINKQLSCLHINFLRAAVQDIYDSNTDKKELKLKIDNFFIANNRYILENKRLNVNSKNVNTFSLKQFCFCLNSKNSKKLFLYLNVRKKLIKLLEKKYVTDKG